MGNYSVGMSMAEHPGLWSRISRAIRHLLFPLLVLLGLYWYSATLNSQPIAFADFFSGEYQLLNPRAWLSVGDIILPATFLVLVLTVRRFWGGMAVRLIMLSWIAVGLFLASMAFLFDPAVVIDRLPDNRTLASFGGAYVVAQLSAIVFYIRWRHRTKWRAALTGLIGAGIIFAILFRTTASWGSDDPWIWWMFGDVLVKIIIGGVLMLPYSIIRPMIRPADGFRLH